MVSITTITSSKKNPSAPTIFEKTQVSTEASNSKAVSSAAQSTSRKSSLSSLAQQLSDASTRAMQRDSTSSHKELGQLAANLLDDITGMNYYNNQAKANAEIPKTNDPALLARASQATDFVSGNGKNPFQGMSRDQLSLISYDDSGQFTVNERRAALVEADTQESEWRFKAAQKAMDEYNSTGKMTEFFSFVLDHYNSLPAIEQAQYPQDYASGLQQKIGSDVNYNVSHSDKDMETPSSIINETLGKSIS